MKAAAARKGVTVMTQNKKGNGKKKKNSLLQIGIPILIVIAIVGIYVIKNNEQKAGGNGQTAENGGQSQISHDEAAFELDATDDFDLEEILSYGLPVIIDFGSDSCIPCKEMAPTLQELNEELRGKVIVKFVDVWENTDAAGDIPLRVIPTQFFFDKDGKPYVPSDENSTFIMYEHKDTGEHLFTAHEGAMEKEDILAVFAEMGVQW